MYVCMYVCVGMGICMYVCMYVGVCVPTLPSHLSLCAFKRRSIFGHTIASMWSKNRSRHGELCSTRYCYNESLIVRMKVCECVCVCICLCVCVCECGCPYLEGMSQASNQEQVHSIIRLVDVHFNVLLQYQGCLVQYWTKHCLQLFSLQPEKLSTKLVFLRCKLA